MEISKTLAKEFAQKETYIENVITLIDEGNTIPFIARYRKEAHGSMGDETLRLLEERLKYLRSLEEKKEDVIRIIEEQGKLTKELEKEILEAETLARVEDLYRPYKQKKRTRASVAKEKGLEPLATFIFSQKEPNADLLKVAEAYVNPEKGVESAEDALKGASDIIAEVLSDDASIRNVLRKYYKNKALLESKAAKEEDSVYEGYYAFSSKITQLPSHRILALNRGEKEGYLKIGFVTEPEEMASLIEKKVLFTHGKSEAFLKNGILDSLNRLICPSLENEIRSTLTEQACEGAIRNFALNLKPLLMQPPVKGKVTLGLDPGYRMGCKCAVVDGSGKVLDTTVVYPTHGEKQKQEAIQKLSALIKKYNVQHIAIGNGTASRETENMTAEMLKRFPEVSYMVVSEAGASVYSASKLASLEFPEYDVNLRSAISIARRLIDPLAELVKIEPKAIGVGQYQHDMPQKKLEESLDSVVEDCVNAVGVDLNTASPSLLRRVSGLSDTVSKNIVAYREKEGLFKNRKELLKVAKLGPKAYTQCAGFLRVPESDYILDYTGVHPESYEVAEKLLKAFDHTLLDVKNGKVEGIQEEAKAYGIERLSKELNVGEPTLLDILKELAKPGRDIREMLPPPIFRKDLLEIADLKPGMILMGTVRNVIDFGAFVDIGVHQDGLVHISEITNRFIKHPSEVLSVGQDVKVSVLSVDPKKNRISLSMKQVPQSVKNLSNMIKA